jgi:hypothetical protein
MKVTRKGRRAVWLAVLVSALSLVAGSTVWAQKTVGEIRGTVTDATGAVVPSASVTVTSVNTGYTRQVTTDTKGEFVLPLLDPGSYRLEVTAGSFKKQTQTVAVRALETTSVQARLELGAITETVEVTVPLENVNVSSGGVAQHLQKELLAEFPNLSRYGFANATLMPAIQQVEERRETINASVAGNTSNRNAFYIDGAEATDPWRGWSPRQPVVDAFEEIVVSTAGATVDVGNNFGGTYNAIFKSGANAFHGGAWYYFRNKSLNANTWVNNRSGLERPDDPLKYFGAQFGGPIIKDKAFFYFTANRETDQQPFSQSSLWQPTTAMVNGDFSELNGRIPIIDPQTGQQFPNNQIPSNRIDPVAKAFWDKYGYSNSGSYTNNRSFQFANERKVWNVNGRLDFNLSEAHRVTISGYWFQNKTSSPDARVQSISGSPTGGSSGNTFQQGGTELNEFTQKVVNGKWTWMAKPNLFIETHAAYSIMPEKCTLDSASLGTTLGTLGANDPLPRSDAPEILPTIVIGQWWGSQEGAILFHGWTTDFTVKNLSLGSSTTWITGSHNVKLGVEFQSGSYHEIQVARENQNGMTFNGNATSGGNPSLGGVAGAQFAHGFADFMLGRYDFYGVNDQSEQTLKSWNLAGYIMDQWRITSRLTVTPGLRYELNSGISEKNGHLTMYRPGLQSTTYQNAPNGIVTAGDAGLSDALMGKSNMISPRLNFAYDVTGDGKTAVRGSAGLYYGRDVMALWQTSFLGRAPYTGTNAVARNGEMSDPWLTSQNPKYTTTPLPFQDQNPSNFQWGSQLSGFYELDPDYSLGSSWQWNIAVERELLKGVRLEASYQGNSSTSTPTAVQTNMAAWADGATTDGSNIQGRRPNQLFGDGLPIVNNEGRTRYDQLLLLARVRRSGLFAQLSWGYTHARRNFGGDTSLVQANRDWDSQVVYAHNIELMRDFNNCQTISGFLSYELPILRNNDTVLGKIAGGWQITANGYWNFNRKGVGVYSGADMNADGINADPAKVIGDIKYPKTELTNQGDLLYQWFDPSAFAYPNGTTTYGLSPNMTYDGNNVLTQLPWTWRVDAALIKSFGLVRDAKVQFRFEVYNLFNHANLNDPINNLNDANFGKIRGKYGDGRRVQMGLRLTF